MLPYLVGAAIVVAIIYFAVKGRAARPAADSGGADFSPEELSAFNEAKEAALERVLGKMHDMVGHAIIPFEIGGAMDMYAFPNAVAGTGFATMELIAPDGSGPRRSRIGTYELVAFTRHKIARGQEIETETPFGKFERRFCGLFTAIGNYSFMAVLNPNETSEVPISETETACIVFDQYAPEGKPFQINGRKHGLLLVIEVFRNEMEWGRDNGGGALIQKLRDAGHWPYSDLNRKPVV